MPFFFRYLCAGVALAVVDCAISGPFPDTTCLNTPPCQADTCTFVGKQPDPETCAALCLANSNCTAYTWSDESVAGYEDDCIFRTDGAWEPENTGKSGWWSGRKLAPPPAWPVTDGFDALPVMWFGANTSGLDSLETLQLIARHRVAGYGWQQGTGTLIPGQVVGRGEVFGAEAATHLTDYLAATSSANRTLVFVYRQVRPEEEKGGYLYLAPQMACMLPPAYHLSPPDCLRPWPLLCVSRRRRK